MCGLMIRGTFSAAEDEMMQAIYHSAQGVPKGI